MLGEWGAGLEELKQRTEKQGMLGNIHVLKYFLFSSQNEFHHALKKIHNERFFKEISVCVYACIQIYLYIFVIVLG